MTIFDDTEYYTKELKWALVPLKPLTKGTNKKGWNKPENLYRNGDFWKNNPNWNVGVHLEESNIVTIDIDNLEYSRILFDALGIDYDEIFENSPRSIGRPNRDKAFFKAPPGKTLGLHKLTWPGKESSTPVVILELRAGAIQDVIPPSIHPDTKLPYAWRRHPKEGIPDLPLQLLSLWEEWDTLKIELENICPWAPKRKLPPLKKRTTDKSDSNVIQIYNERNRVEPLLSRYGYKRTPGGRYLSPHSTTNIPGVVVFTAENKFFSHHASDPFDSQHAHDPFDLYCEYEHAGNISIAVKEAAKELELGIYDTQKNKELIEHGHQIAQVFLQKPPKTDNNPLSSIPKELLKIPGVLQDVVDYYNKTAYRSQPQFAVQTALALGSVVCGRRFCTDDENYTSLYFICVGVSSCGKEHVKTTIDTILFESQVSEKLRGPSRYKSGMGVFSSLAIQPCHITVIDEIGRYLQAVKMDRQSHLTEAITEMMEIFGRGGQAHFLPGYSRVGITNAQKQQYDDFSVIMKPSLTLIGMTVPGRFYDALTSNEIVDGFMPRFIVVESVLGRQMGHKKQSVAVTEKIKEWIQNHYKTYTDDGNLTGIDAAQHPPNPVIIPI
ncbi:MAG TPA: bifunctional DNA primase/polymerase, partial [Candidatus Thermoplasmatota archaeon]|nr:bifunctional DNA primase/polymerase [Candidatus Thermoplasmatota archaeon]